MSDNVIPFRKYLIDDALDYESDSECQRFVADHPDGACLEEIAAIMGITRERVRQIENIAVRKIRNFHAANPRRLELSDEKLSWAAINTSRAISLHHPGNKRRRVER